MFPLPQFTSICYYSLVKHPYLFHFTNVVISLCTTINMPMILISFPECTAVEVSGGMVNWFISIPVKLMAPLLAKTPNPAVFVGEQTVIETHPGTAFN